MLFPREKIDQFPEHFFIALLSAHIRLYYRNFFLNTPSLKRKGIHCTCDVNYALLCDSPKIPKAEIHTSVQDYWGYKCVMGDLWWWNYKKIGEESQKGWLPQKLTHLLPGVSSTPHWRSHHPTIVSPPCQYLIPSLIPRIFPKKHDMVLPKDPMLGFSTSSSLKSIRKTRLYMGSWPQPLKWNQMILREQCQKHSFKDVFGVGLVLVFMFFSAMLFAESCKKEKVIPCHGNCYLYSCTNKHFH